MTLRTKYIINQAIWYTILESEKFIWHLLSICLVRVSLLYHKEHTCWLGSLPNSHNLT